jgi:hypothetical protein
MIYKEISESIIALKNADLEHRDQLIKRRELGEGYNKEMESLHIHNAVVLNDIIDAIGYPTIYKVGREASAAAWLVIQHSISKPNFMKKCVKLIENETDDTNVNPLNLAYLTDRIAVLEGKPQLYGTQFDWDENNTMSPQFYDDLSKVNKRRNSLGLNTLEEQIIVMRLQANRENLKPPKDFEKRRKLYNQWKKK